MRKLSKISSVGRIIDANLNRAKEGLRVCEEVARFILGSVKLTSDFKKTRHAIDTLMRQLPIYRALINERKSDSDVGKNIYASELIRKDYKDIFFANIQRVKESLRVLEEFSKLFDAKTAIKFKELRYRLYGIEKEAVKGIASLRNHR